MSFNSRGEFPEHDRMMLELSSKSTWVPPEPAKLVKPYIEKNPIEQSDNEKKRQKAQEVMDNYGKIIEECKTLRTELEEKCKNVSVPLNPDVDIRVIEACARLFKRQATEITFDMYKEAIRRLAVVSDSQSPKLGGSNGTS